MPEKYHIRLAGLQGNTFAGHGDAYVKGHPFLASPPGTWGAVTPASHRSRKNGATVAILLIGLGFLYMRYKR